MKKTRRMFWKQSRVLTSINMDYRNCFQVILRRINEWKRCYKWLILRILRLCCFPYIIYVQILLTTQVRVRYLGYLFGCNVKMKKHQWRISKTASTRRGFILHKKERSRLHRSFIQINQCPLEAMSQAHLQFLHQQGLNGDNQWLHEVCIDLPRPVLSKQHRLAHLVLRSDCLCSSFS